MQFEDMVNLLLNSLPYLLKGAGITIALSIVSLFLGTVLAIFFAMCRYLETPLLRTIGDIYVSIFRGTPLLVQLFVIYYGLPQLGLSLSPITSAIIGKRA